MSFLSMAGPARRPLFFLMVILAATAAAHCTAADAVPRVHLFILAGEANMVALNPRGAFTRTIKKAFPKDHCIVVHEAQADAPIGRWDRTWWLSSRKDVHTEERGDLYTRLKQQTREALQNRRPDTATLIWLQGETDAKLGLSKAYEDALEAVITRLRDDVGRDDMHVVIGRLNDHGLGQSFSREWSLLRLTHVDVAEMDPHGDWVNTDDLNGEQDALLFTGPGLKILGKRLADRAVRLIATTPPAS